MIILRHGRTDRQRDGRTDGRSWLHRTRRRQGGSKNTRNIENGLFLLGNLSLNGPNFYRTKLLNCMSKCRDISQTPNFGPNLGLNGLNLGSKLLGQS